MVTARKMSAPKTVPAIAPTGVVDGVEDAEADVLVVEVGEVVPAEPMVEEGEFLLMHEVSSEETTV